MSYIDKLLDHYHNPDAEPDPWKMEERYARWYAMTEEQQQELTNKATEVHSQLAKSGIELGTEPDSVRLPHKTSKQLQQELKIKTRYTVRQHIKTFLSFAKDNPNDPLVLAFVNMAGRPPMQLLTPEQAIFAIGAYLTTSWKVIIDEETVVENKKVKIRVPYIYNWLQQVYPELRHRVTLRALENYLGRVVAADEAVFTYAWEGERAAWMKFVPKLPNNFTAAGQCIQVDGRPLPIYVRAESGATYTVTLVTLVDAYTLYVPGFLLVPRLEEHADGTTERVDFRNEDVRLLIANMMLLFKMCPRMFYTDNGGQFKALQRILNYLRSGLSSPEVVLGFPLHPWGRGAVEVVAKLVDTVLQEQPGYIRDEDDLQSLSAAQDKATLTLEELERLVKRYFKKWNTERVDGQPSRFDQWKATRDAHPTPPSERLYFIANGRAWEERKVHDTHIEYNTAKYYLKRQTDPVARARWVDAVGKRVTVCHTEHYDDQQRRYTRRVYAALDGQTFDELESYEVNPGLSARERKGYQRNDMTHIAARLAKLRDAFNAQLATTGYEDPALDPVEGTVVPAPQPSRGRGASAVPSPAVAGQSADSTQPQPAERNNQSNEAESVPTQQQSAQSESPKPVPPPATQPLQQQPSEHAKRLAAKLKQRQAESQKPNTE